MCMSCAPPPSAPKWLVRIKNVAVRGILKDEADVSARGLVFVLKETYTIYDHALVISLQAAIVDYKKQKVF